MDETRHAQIDGANERSDAAQAASATRRPSAFVVLATSLGAAVLVGGGLWAATLQPLAGQGVTGADAAAPPTAKQDVPTQPTTQPSQARPPQTETVAPTVLPGTAPGGAPPTTMRPGGYRWSAPAPPPWSPPPRYTPSPTRTAPATNSRKCGGYGDQYDDDKDDGKGGDKGNGWGWGNCR